MPNLNNNNINVNNSGPKIPNSNNNNINVNNSGPKIPNANNNNININNNGPKMPNLNEILTNNKGPKMPNLNNENNKKVEAEKKPEKIMNFNNNFVQLKPIKKEELKPVKKEEPKKDKKEEPKPIIKNEPKKENVAPIQNQNKEIKTEKKEVPKIQNNIQNKINNFLQPKIEEKKIQPPKKEIVKNNEKPVKKEEIKKEEPKPSEPIIGKKLSMADRIKMMEGQGKVNNNPKPAPAPQKRFSAIENKFSFNQEKKEEKNNKPTTKKNESKPSGPVNKFSDMKKMLEMRGIGGGSRPSAQLMGVPNLGNMGQNNNTNQNAGIVKEKVDKENPGYNPVNDLEKKLDNIVVQKDKKKKKKINFQG